MISAKGAKMAGGKEFQVYCSEINYTVVLDETNKICELRNGNTTFCRSNRFGLNQIGSKALKNAFKYLMIEDVEKFEELYQILKQNDSGMFEHAYNAVCEMRNFCLTFINKNNFN